MIPSVKLEVGDTEGFRLTVTEAYKAGKEFNDPKAGEEQKRFSGDYYGRLLHQICQQAENLAERAFEAGRRSNPIKEQ